MARRTTLGTKQSVVRLRQVDTRLFKIGAHKDFEEHSITDFTADGDALLDVMRQHDPDAPELTTGLQDDFDSKYKIAYLQRLLGGTPDLDSGRVALYVCPFDGDLQCAAIGCRIELGDDTVRWYDFAWDGNIPDDEAEADDPDAKIEGLETYTFDRTQYETIIKNMLSKL